MRLIAMLVRFFSFRKKIEYKRNSFCDGSNTKKSFLLLWQAIVICMALGASFGFAYLLYLLLIDAWYYVPMLIFTIFAGIITFFLVVQSIISGIALDSACFRGRVEIIKNKEVKVKTSKFDKFLGVLNIILFFLIFIGVGLIAVFIVKKYNMH